jgi:hypothetical protein
MLAFIRPPVYISFTQETRRYCVLDSDVQYKNIMCNRTNAWLNRVKISEFFAVLSDTIRMDCRAVNRTSSSIRVLSITHTQVCVISGRHQLPEFWVQINNEVQKTENCKTRIVFSKLKTYTNWGTSAELNGVSRFKLPVRGKSSDLFFGSLRRLMWRSVESNREKVSDSRVNGICRTSK